MHEAALEWCVTLVCLLPGSDSERLVSSLFRTPLWGDFWNAFRIHLCRKVSFSHGGPRRGGEKRQTKNPFVALFRINSALGEGQHIISLGLVFCCFVGCFCL